MSSLYTKRGFYYYDGSWRDPNGQVHRVQHSLRTKNKGHAEQMQRRYDELYHRKSNDPNVTTSLFSAAKDRYMRLRKQQVKNESLSQRTVDSDQTAFNVFDQFLIDRLSSHAMIHEIDHNVIRDFKNRRLEAVSSTTVANNLRHLRAFFGWLEQSELIRENPFKRVKLPKSRRRETIPLKEDWEDLKEMVQLNLDRVGPPITHTDSDGVTHEIPNWFFSLLHLQMNTGMRLGEIAILKFRREMTDRGTGHSTNYAYLSSREKQITIFFKRTKRTVPVKNIWPFIESLVESKRDGQKFVFENSQTELPYTVWWLCRLYRWFLDEMKFPREFSSHAVRHGFVSDRLREGVPQYIVGKIVGHSSQTMTETYSHIVASDLANHMP